MQVWDIDVTVHRQAFSELKMPYDTVVAADFADLECGYRRKSVTERGTIFDKMIYLQENKALFFF